MSTVKIIGAVMILCPVAYADVVGSQSRYKSNAEASLEHRGLTTPSDYARVSAGFHWQGADELEIMDVTFGIKDGELRFARYRAVNRTGRERIHDWRDEMDYVVGDSLLLPQPVKLRVFGDQFAMITGFSMASTDDGRIYLDELHGTAPNGERIDWEYTGPARFDPGTCAPPLVSGTCGIGTCLLGSCVPDFPDCDPCDCTSFGQFCTDGTASIICPGGACDGSPCKLLPDCSICQCITFKGNDPSIWYSETDPVLNNGILTCTQPGGSLSCSGSTTQSISWNLQSTVSSGFSLSGASSELSSTFGVTVGNSVTVSTSRTVTPWNGWSATVLLYPSYQKRIFNVTQNAEQVVVEVFVPTGGCAVCITESHQVPECNCGGGGRGDQCEFPQANESSCMSGNPSAPTDPEDACGGAVPAVSTWGMLVMVLLVMMAGSIQFRRRRYHASSYSE